MKKSIAIILGLMLIFVTVLPVAAASTVSLQSISLSKTNVYLRVGQSFNLKVSLTPANTSENKITFTSSSKTTVSVSNMGILKGIKTGTATITASSANKKVTAKCTVTVISSSSKNTIVIGDKSSPGTLAPYNETSLDRAKATNYIYENSYLCRNRWYIHSCFSNGLYLERLHPLGIQASQKRKIQQWQ